jgi:8-oxo-dGTP pyrophosphatase MutT (NUDIX family)
MQKQALITAINAYLVRYPADIHATETLDFLAANDDFWQSEQQKGHITSSAWVLDATMQCALLTHHRKLERWFQLGGHVEREDFDIFEAALREASEESGLKDLYFYKKNMDFNQKEIFDIDVHLIPCSKKGFPAHFHYDIRVLLIANAKSSLNFQKEESNEVKWFDLADIPSVSTEISMQRMVAKTTLL